MEKLLKKVDWSDEAPRLILELPDQGSNRRPIRWPCDQMRRSEATWFMGSRFRILLRVWKFISCDCCVLCRKRPVRRADHSFGGVLPSVWVSVCDPKTSKVTWSRLSWAVAPEKDNQSPELNKTGYSFKWGGFWHSGPKYICFDVSEKRAAAG